ncbi:hypothetical protein HWB79_gp171 [Streptomyces phage LukeCage]|jgi:hypothetical protein|uniref:DUF7736 domain-containing protein n=1 Tax=Streptomyces phage LukeCage TaxID=2283304 RepID=A0A345MGG0_9CAUD|nr:hypothetical protein HWB79_gp171 [Streptomyces phage LukeCage]AXH69641.1 hypothetical protein SEA_LUKECAGE_124 [Streptomyces phage LukeCage]
MTKREAAIVAVFTGILIGDFADMHEYIEELVDRPVWTHELASEEFAAKLKELARPDFMEIVVE